MARTRQRWTSPPAYALEVSRGYVRLVRTGGQRYRFRPTRLHLDDDGEWREVSDEFDPTALDEAAEAEAERREQLLWADDVSGDGDVADSVDEATRPRGSQGQTDRSRMNLRRLITALPWELLGPRPALISLTYPGNWQPWVPDGRTWEVHRKAFERRWVRRWGEPLVGVWVKEFQTSGRPHIHLYVGLPSTMSDDDFEGLRQRTLIRHRLEREHGTYAGRNRTPPSASPATSAAPSASGCAPPGRRSSAPPASPTATP